MPSLFSEVAWWRNQMTTLLPFRVHSGTVASVSVNEHPQDISEIEW